jgi:hypothetical protein
VPGMFNGYIYVLCNVYSKEYVAKFTHSTYSKEYVKQTRQQLHHVMPICGGRSMRRLQPATS